MNTSKQVLFYKPVLSLIIIILFSVLLGCTDSPLAGVIRDGNYYNSYFGLQFEIPAGWHIIPDETDKFIKDVSAELVSPAIRNRQSVQNDIKANNHYLLSLSNHEYGMPSEDTSVISLIIENVSIFPAIKSGKEYLEAAMASSKKMQVEVSFGEISEVTIDGEQFYRLSSMYPFRNKFIYATSYCRKIKGYILAYQLTFKQETDYKNQDKYLSYLKLRK